MKILAMPLYYIYGSVGPSLLIESTNSMILYFIYTAIINYTVGILKPEPVTIGAAHLPRDEAVIKRAIIFITPSQGCFLNINNY